MKAINQTGITSLILLLTIFSFLSGAIVLGSFYIKNNYPKRIAELNSLFIKTPISTSSPIPAIIQNQAKINQQPDNSCLDLFKSFNLTKLPAETLLATNSISVDLKSLEERVEMLDLYDLNAAQVFVNSTAASSIELFDPKGNKVDPITTGESATFYSLAKPLAGRWKAKIKNGPQDSSGIIRIIGESNINLLVAAQSLQFYYRAGEDKVFCLYLAENKQPIAQAKISSKVINTVNNQVYEINFSNIPQTPVYSAIDKTITKAGKYVLSAHVNGTALSQHPFSREVASAPFEILNQDLATFNTQINSETADENQDGLYDNLIIQGAVDVKKAGEYSLVGVLESTDSKPVAQARDLMNLSHGKVKWSLKFSGHDISKSGINGPYILSSLILNNTHESITADALIKSYKTSVFKVDQFQR